MELQIEGIICIVIVFIILVYLIRNKSIDSFIVLLNEVVIPKDCPNSLVTDGVHFYLMNTRLPYDGITNPIKFNSEAEAKKYLKNNNCPDLQLLDLVVSKNKEDPTDSYEKICARDVANRIFDDDVCNHYSDGKQMEDLRNFSNDLIVLTETRNQIRSEIDAAKFANREYDPKLDVELKEVLKKIDNLRSKYANNDEALKEFVDYKIEDCMIQTIKNENNNLDDSKFSNNFAKYFNNLNENIGQHFLYV